MWNKELGIRKRLHNGEYVGIFWWFQKWMWHGVMVLYDVNKSRSHAHTPKAQSVYLIAETATLLQILTLPKYRLSCNIE